MKVELLHSSKLRVRLLEPMFTPNYGSTTYIIPAGFESDLATVPRPLWHIFPPFGKYARAAVIHDYCYFKLRERMTRKEADQLFLDVMKRDGVGRVTRYCMYSAVRCFAWVYWG